MQGGRANVPMCFSSRGAAGVVCGAMGFLEAP